MLPQQTNHQAPVLPEAIVALGQTKNCIRTLTEYADRRKAEIGRENVFDFSLGNPSIPAPDCINETILELIRRDDHGLHGEVDSRGLPELRQRISDHLRAEYDVYSDPDQILVTCGAAAGLAICMHAILMPGDEVITFTPFFPEYRVFVETAGGVLITVPSDEDSFQPSIEHLRRAITKRTKAILLNSPNNPSGVVISEQNLKRITEFLKRWTAETGNRIFLISDEPYRELVYDGVKVPSASRIYEDSILCYSFSKSMSIPGERIGYIALNNGMPDREELYTSICGAALALGYEGPPVLFQRVVAQCIGQTSDIGKYKRNRDLLLDGLRHLGYTCVEPQGAFYLFVKALEPDAKAFSEHAKKYELILVPSDDFGCTGYVRIAYCVSPDVIVNSMPAFQKLKEDYS